VTSVRIGFLGKNMTLITITGADHLLIVLTLQTVYRLRGTKGGSSFSVPIVAHLSAFVHVLHFASYSLVIQEDMGTMPVQKTRSSDLRRTNKQVLRPDAHLQVAITLSACG